MTIEQTDNILDDDAIDDVILPSTEFMRGYLAANPDGFDVQMREWLDALIGETERTREMFSSLPGTSTRRYRNGLDFTPTEMRVYRYLRNTIMTQPEIATAMYLSINTIKTHTKNIYAKCGVGRRSELQHFPAL